MDSQDKDLVSSISSVKQFSSSFVWEDMQTLLNERIEYLQTQLERCNTIEEVKMIQGRLSELRVCNTLPETLEESINQQKQELKQRSNHGNS